MFECCLSCFNVESYDIYGNYGVVAQKICTISF